MCTWKVLESCLSTQKVSKNLLVNVKNVMKPLGNSEISNFANVSNCQCKLKIFVSFEKMHLLLS